MRQKKLLFVGFGDIASRTAAKMAADGWQVTAIARSPRELPPGYRFWQGDVKSAAIQQKIAGDAFDAVVITLTPSERSDAGYRAAYVEPVAALCETWRDAQPPGQVIFVSSTSVYGQREGEWVNEDSSTEPARYNGERVLEAERLLRQTAARLKPMTATVVRFSGIYGPGRDHLQKQVLAGKAGGDNYTNRIHIEDCVGVLGFLLAQHAQGETLAPCYLASDCAPVTSAEVRTWLAEQLGVSLTEPPPGGGSKGKRCDNRRIQSAGYQFVYPDYRAGYRAILQAKTAG